MRFSACKAPTNDAQSLDMCHIMYYVKSACRGRKVSKAILVHEVRKDNLEILGRLVKSAFLDLSGKRCVHVTHLQYNVLSLQGHEMVCSGPYDCRDHRAMSAHLEILETME